MRDPDGRWASGDETNLPLNPTIDPASVATSGIKHLSDRINQSATVRRGSSRIAGRPTKLYCLERRVNLNQVTLPALDIERSVAFYQQMGFTLIVSSPHYARFECPEGDSTFSVHLAEDLCQDTGVVVYFECADVDHRVEVLQARGLSFSQLPADQSWLWREARLRDPAGNMICLFWAGENRKNPPWRVQAAV